MEKKQHLKLIWPVSFMVLIFIESSIPMDGGPDNIVFLTNLDPTLQNLLHIPLYGILSYLWCRSLCTHSGQITLPAIILSLFITILYGCLDEFHQSFVRGRYGGLMDIYLNTIGAFCGVVVFKLKVLKTNQ